eukprot:Tamp_07138.p2 GENE.Tamp_07138~~Tamp_07138.p2  ORF type:complete len:408 (-),score=57.24 Tamp_07138:1338-2495(-)
MSGEKNPLDNLFGGIAGFFTCICEPQSCAPRGQAPEYSEEASNVPPRVDDERFAEMESDEGIQRSFRSYSSVSKNGRAIERGNFPSFCRHFFYRVDPSYALTTDDMNMLWEFFDRQKQGSIDMFQYGIAIKQLLANRAGKRALILVDFQNDFVTGSLKVTEASEAVRAANRLRDKFASDMVWLTRDWHPPDHMSFHDNHGAEAFSIKSLPLPNGEVTDQVMWPRHCVQGSEGAKWCPDLIVKDTDITIDKGLNPKVDSYSGFFDNCKGYETRLQGDLRSRGVSEVYIAGLAYDYCVGYTALDAKSCGFTTYVADDCTRSVSKDSEMAMTAKLAEHDIIRILSSEIPRPFTANGTHMMCTVRQLMTASAPYANGTPAWANTNGAMA